MIVESPGLVRSNNMREMHFSRNPQIIEFLHVYEYVKEFGEGVDRMYREMAIAGWKMCYLSYYFIQQRTYILAIIFGTVHTHSH